MKYSTTNLSIRSRFSALSLIAVLFIPFNLQAEEAGAFLGFAIGQMDPDDRVLAWKFLGGYHFNEHFSAELAYVDARKAPIEIAGATLANFGLSGFTFAGVYRYPVTSQFNIFAKGGGFIWSAELEWTSTANQLVGRTLNNIEDDGTSYFAGAGAEFEVIENLSLRAEWERLDADADGGGLTDGGGLNFLSLGLLYKF